ncbi:WD40 repeat domain-containing protein [Streptomyces sp. NPDC001852]|uniref:WD40 repeat domain-containing protein n=1 Tax=Streptomyces sp. NPDC001852 TaxID=3364619 RepID=UPI00368740F4
MTELEAFAAELRDLRIECGNPSLRDIEKAAPPSRPLSASAISEALNGKRLPRLDFFIALVQTLIRFRSGTPVNRENPRVEQLRLRWQELERLRVSVPRNTRSDRTPASQRSSATPTAAYMPHTGPMSDRGLAERAVLAALARGRLISLAPLQHDLAPGAKLVSAAFSPKDELLASAGSDGKVQLWDPVTGRSRGVVMTGHTGPLTVMAFSPDGTLLASAGSDGKVQLWDPVTGRSRGVVMTDHTGPLTAMAFSPDGRLLASGGGDATVRLWNPINGQAVGEPMIGHSAVINAVTFSCDGTLLASAGADGRLRLWQPDAQRLMNEILSDQNPVANAVAFSPDGTLLASGGADRVVQLWTADTGRAADIPLAKVWSTIVSVAFSPDGAWIAAAGDDSAVLWAQDQTVSKRLYGNGQELLLFTNAFVSVAFSPDGTLLAGAGEDGKVGLWAVPQRRA